MKKSGIFGIISYIVADIYEVDIVDIMSPCRKRNVVDARCLVVVYSKKYGLTNEDLLLLFGKKNNNSIAVMSEDYYSRLQTSYFFRLADDYVSNKIKETLKEPEKNQPNKK
jgi:hypothetical protein